MPDVYRLGPRAIWRYLQTQPASFWFVCIYLFFEYVRPQQLFPIINFLPWGQVILGLTTLALLIGARGFSDRSSIPATDSGASARRRGSTRLRPCTPA